LQQVKRVKTGVHAGERLPLDGAAVAGGISTISVFVVHHTEEWQRVVVRLLNSAEKRLFSTRRIRYDMRRINFRRSRGSEVLHANANGDLSAL